MIARNMVFLKTENRLVYLPKTQVIGYKFIKIMYNTFDKGTITAQNPTNQSHTANFDGTKELFNAVNENELKAGLENFNFGIVKPDYIISNLRMAEQIIDRARIPDEKKSVLRNSFGFLLGAIVSTAYYELIYQEDSPDGYRNRLENGEDKDEIADSLNYEIGCLINDLDNDLVPKNYLGFYDEAISEVEEAISEFRDVADEFGIQLDR